MAAESRTEMQELRIIENELMMLAQLSSLMHWDLETQIPSGGVPRRAEQLSYLSGLMHKKTIDPRVGELLEKASSLGDLDERQKSWLRVLRRDYEQATKLPQKHVEEVSRVTSLANHAWVQARSDNDFAAFAPHLERIVQLNRDAAGYLGYSSHPYDALLDQYEQGMTVELLDEVFPPLQKQLTELTAAIAQAKAPRNDFLFRDYPAAGQEVFSRKVAADIGFDFSRGFLARSAHPFTIELSSDDIRITTRYEENYLPTALFGVIHEVGHAMYEQGFPAEIANTFLAGGTSLGIHESQSRFWENTIGRSRAFWQRYYPQLQQQFSTQLADVDVEAFYRGINVVQPSLIRVEADEVTYGLHVILRYELEKQLISGTLAVRDLPEAWNDATQRLLGLRPDSDSNGVLQDVHWSHGSFGYFPTYVLGNMYAAQFSASLEAEKGPLDSMISAGDFGAILSWLRKSIHQWGRGKTPLELLQDVCGKGLDAQPFIDSLHAKYSEIYSL